MSAPKLTVNQSHATITGVGVATDNSAQSFTQHSAPTTPELANAISELKTLLTQLFAQTPHAETSHDVLLATMEEQIKKNPTLKARLSGALKAGGTEALKKALELVVGNPLVSIPVEAVKGFIEGE